MDKNKEHNLTVFCDQIRSQKGKMADFIIQDICCGQAEDPSDSWAWNFYQTFNLVEEFLQECKLWQTSYYINNIR